MISQYAKYRHPYCRGVPDRETTVEGNMDGVLGVEEANFKNGLSVGH